MELVTGVRIHFMKSEKFKTNEIKVRFSAPLSEETIAGTGSSLTHDRNSQSTLSNFTAI